MSPLWQYMIKQESRVFLKLELAILHSNPSIRGTPRAWSCPAAAAPAPSRTRAQAEPAHVEPPIFPDSYFVTWAYLGARQGRGPFGSFRRFLPFCLRGRRNPTNPFRRGPVAHPDLYIADCFCQR